MTIVSLAFFAFVAALLVVYFVAPKNWRWTVLLAGSLVFYWLNSGKLLLRTHRRGDRRMRPGRILPAF